MQNKFSIEICDNFTGSFTTLTTDETIEIELLKLNESSKKKFSQIIDNGSVTKDNQILLIKELVLNNNEAKKLRSWQSQLVKTDTGYALPSKPINTPHYYAKIMTCIPMDDGLIYAVEFYLGNFQLDFKNTTETIYDKQSIAFNNIILTAYPGKYWVKVLE